VFCFLQNDVDSESLLLWLFPAFRNKHYSHVPACK